MEESQQELMFKLNMFEQQIQQLQQQSQAVEQGIIEMQSLDTGLDELVGSKGKEILAPIGRGIFVKTKLLSEELTIEIGGKNFVKKSIPEAKKIINEQIKKLGDIKEDLKKNLDFTSQELISMINEAQKKEEKK